MQKKINNWKTKKATILDKLRGTKRWKELREAILRNNPLCVVCFELGRMQPAVEIHHVVPAHIMLQRHGREGFFDQENLAPVCVSCHDRNERAWQLGTADTIFPLDKRGAKKWL